MSDVVRKKPIPRATKAQVEVQQAEARRLRAKSLTVVVIGARLGVSPQWAGDLLKPVPPNHCGGVRRTDRAAETVSPGLSAIAL